MSPSLVGQTLGHYRIESKLGEGGMGAVWKARDTRLDRFVALKTLPAEKLADQDRRRRFVQEAKTASALNHPNIVHIYDIADAEAMPFIAMEYVAGKTLDQLIGRKGLRLSESLRYAVQIADALARAHSAGIIHRDLKPSNIMVDEHGLVKVLDFGLAKLTETSTGEFWETETVRVPAGPDTEEGTIVGTVAYMSPEQAEGKMVDARSDIFSFGSVLYEMVTGQRAFRGDSKLSTLSAILKEEPKPVASIMPDVPRDLEKIISHCLRKDPNRRFQHMDELTKELIDDNSPAFSPDGRQVVFVRWESYYVSDLYVVPVVGGEPKRLTFDNRLNRGPVWMPDGRSIVFSSERDGSPALWKIPARGGKAEKIVDAPGRDLIPGVSRQGPEGAPRLAFSESFVDTNIWKMDATGRGASSQLIASTRDEVAPDFSPDGKRIAFASNRSGHWEIWVCDSDGADALQLTSFRGTFVGSPRWSPDGRQIAFDARPEGNGGIFVINAQGGAPRRVTTEPSNEMVPSWSRDGRWIYFASNRGGGYQIWKMPAEGGSAARVTKKGGFVSQESPDGKFLYYSKRPGPLDPSSGVWRTAVEGGEETQIVERGLERFWVVRENGIYFVYPDESHRAVLEFLPFATRRSTRIATLEKPLEFFLGGLAVSSDGQWILYSQLDSANIDIMLLENFRASARY